MRDILFRGKRADTGEWLYGSFASVDRDAFIISRTTEPDTENGGSIPSCITVIPSTVGQYVGVVDRNGRCIFEGDIVKGGNQYNEFHLGTVSFGRYPSWGYDDSYNLGCFIEWADCVHWRKELAFWAEEKKIEVIGNIHDNPEILGDAVL